MWSVKDKLDSSILILKSTDTVLVAKDLLIDQELFCLPVVENGKVNYMVSLADLAEFEEDQRLSDLSEVHILEFPFARLEQHFFEAIQLMMNANKVLSLPVLGKDDTYLGIVRLKDLVLNYIPKNFENQEASLIVLEMDDHDYSLTNIANIVEYNRCKILQSITVAVQDRKIWVQLVVNSTTIQSTLAGFDRYGYTIIFTKNQLDTESPLEDRYKSLLKYLDL